MKKPTGTREWATYNYNIGKGCSYNCSYCYSRYDALRFKRIATPAEWKQEEILEKNVKKWQGKREGVIMFPTAHDISLYYLEPSIIVLKKILKAGNNVLIVTKPRKECITKLIQVLSRYKSQILFRFTIGSLHVALCKLWEPGAPSPIERISVLLAAHKSGFRTSVSVEPMLGDNNDMINLYKATIPYITDSIWFGKMNRIRQRVLGKSSIINALISKVESQQTDEKIWELYDALKDAPKVKWKDSIKKIVRIEEPLSIGMDI